MSGRGRAALGAWAAGLMLLLGDARDASAVALDDADDLRLGLRTYAAVRFGTERMGGEENPLTFPPSAVGHVRQNRYFVQLDLDHDLTRYARTGGLARALAGWLDPGLLRYSLSYRGQWEGIYDYGPLEFRDQRALLERFRLPSPDLPAFGFSNRLPPAFIDEWIDRLRDEARQRQQLYLAYLDVEKGPIFVRGGRQILAWGETDAFRLLDNINPLDASFGGLFIPLDERRAPLDMVRASYNFGSLGPFADTFIEGFVADGSTVSTDPGIPPGSPWEPGGLGYPNPVITYPVENPDGVRGGARLVSTVRTVTFTLAHYYSYLDVPGVRLVLPGTKQCPGEPLALNVPRFCNPIVAEQIFPRVPISGGALTFAVPRFYAVVRSEVAYFQGEPFNRQGAGNAAFSIEGKGAAGTKALRRHDNTEGGLDPFVYPRFLDPARTAPEVGRVLQRDSFNVALGVDVNRFVRWLNPTQTIFFSTQVFYKHVFDSPDDLVLPVPQRLIRVPASLPIVGTGCPTASGRPAPCKQRPRFYRLNHDTILHTLLVSTSYWSGRVVPALTIFYDWIGNYLVQPGVTMLRDPFRMMVDYSWVNGVPGGQIGTVRDRDTVRVQVEYVF